MRTGGDDLAEALALIGVQPVWDGVSRRVIDFEILPLSILGRPRVDVTLRISGFFRDAFPNLIDLFDSAVNAVANLDEPADQNPLAAKVQEESTRWQAEGLTLEQAEERSRYRVFGSKPSAYGAGLQGLIESQNWESEADLARAYINWSAYAYTSKSEGKSAPEAFNQRLGNMQIVLQNQDNREHDILDSDDYYQFQGGMTAAIASVSGNAPEVYFGDNSRTSQPKVRKLSEEIARVYRSRVVIPNGLHERCVMAIKVLLRCRQLSIIYLPMMLRQTAFRTLCMKVWLRLIFLIQMSKILLNLVILGLCEICPSVC